MKLFDYYLQYMTEILEGKRIPPEGLDVVKDEQGIQMPSLVSALGRMGMETFVRKCSAQDGIDLPEEVYTGDDGTAAFTQMLNESEQEKMPETASNEPDPDAGKHPFEVFLDCIGMDDDLVRYLIETLKTDDRKEFYKLSQITTKMDLDPHEFLYWLGHKEDFGDEDERECAVIMDQCIIQLIASEQGDVAAALLSGDEKTFEAFRRQSSALVHRKEATFEWYCKNYLDRDYPMRLLLRLNGIEFPDSIKE